MSFPLDQIVQPLGNRQIGSRSTRPESCAPTRTARSWRRHASKRSRSLSSGSKPRTRCHCRSTTSRFVETFQLFRERQEKSRAPTIFAARRIQADSVVQPTDKFDDSKVVVLDLPESGGSQSGSSGMTPVRGRGPFRSLCRHSVVPGAIFRSLRIFAARVALVTRLRSLELRKRYDPGRLGVSSPAGGMRRKVRS
jgi:hypothetical protein